MRNMPRVYTSFMPNAPILNGVPGAMLDVIKKCLIGGWTPFDVTKIVVADGLATISYPTNGTSLPDYCRLVISGCEEPQLNKDFTIIRGGDISAVFETTVADGTYGGTIKASPEPAGWDILFSGTNEAIIKSNNEDGSGTNVKIIDKNATTCSFEFAFDSTGINGLIDPAHAVNNYKRVILKSKDAVPTTSRGWCIIADNSTIYIIIDMLPLYNNERSTRGRFLGGRLNFFGDIIATDIQESSLFGGYFSAIDEGTTDYNYSYTEASPQYSNICSESWIMARPIMRFPKTTYSKLGLATFNPMRDFASSSVNRSNGTESNLNILFTANLESSYRKVPVYARVGGANNGISILGQLPGYRYSDYNIRSIFTPFTTSEDKDGNVYLYIPTEDGSRTTDDFNNSFGMIPFLINKKWS